MTASAATLPSVSVGDVSISEGTGGTVTAMFTLTQDKRGKSTVTYKTANGTRHELPPITSRDPARSNSRGRSSREPSPSP